MIQYYLCCNCYWVTDSWNQLTTHYHDQHQYTRDTMAKLLVETHTLRMVNLKFTYDHDLPEEYKMILAGTTVLDTPVHFTCPVPGCDDSVKWNFEHFRTHWKRYHVPFESYILCRQCRYKTNEVSKLGEHYMRSHQIKQSTAEKFAQHTLWKEQKNSEFHDPVYYRHPWKLVNVITDQKLKSDHSIKDTSYKSETVDQNVESVEDAKPSTSSVISENLNVLGSYDVSTLTGICQPNVCDNYTFEDIVKNAWKMDHPLPIVIIIRGLPGSGKSKLARFIKVSTS